MRCTAPKSDWIDEEKLKTAWERNFVYQCVANHVNPYPFLPGEDENGVPYADRPPPKCPHCGKTVDAKLTLSGEADEAFRLQLERARAGELDAEFPYEKDGVVHRLPSWRYEGRVIWGLTHRILSGLLALDTAGR